MRYKGANFAWACLITFGNWCPIVHGSFCFKCFIFLENGKNCHSLVFTVLQIYIKIKSLLEYKSMWPSGCVFRSHSCFNLITLSQVRVPAVSNLLIFFFFNFELVYCVAAFHFWFIIFSGFLLGIFFGGGGKIYFMQIFLLCYCFRTKF